MQLHVGWITQQRYRNWWLVRVFGVLASKCAMDTAEHWIRTIRRQSEWKVQLVHFAQPPHRWCVSLAANCQLGYDMSAQLVDDGSVAYVSADITCHFSCSSSQLQHAAQLHSRAQMTTRTAVFGRPTSWLQSIRFGCNVWIFRLSSKHRLSAGMQPAKSELSCLYYQGCTWSASLYYVSAWCNLSAVQMPCQLSCNALAQTVSIKWQLLAAISHSRCQQSMSRYYIADFWQSSTASKWKGVCCVSGSRCSQWRWSHDWDEVDDATQTITSLGNIVLQLQKHAKELGVHPLNDAALRSQQLQHQHNPSTGCLQQHSHQPSAGSCCRRKKDWLETCAASCNGLVTLLGFYTRGPTQVQVVAGKNVFRHSLPTCTKQELTLQLFLF